MSPPLPSPFGSAPPVLVKKYPNRRLYDTHGSRYVTQDELADIVRSGSDVRVVDAESGDDLTQATLTQIIMDGRGASRLLPVPLLHTLLRMGDDALGEFFSAYLGTALEGYLQLKRGAQSLSPYVPFASAPFDATAALARMLLGGMGFGQTQPVAAPPPPPPSPTPPPESPARDEVAAMRRELSELKRAIGAGSSRRRKK